MSKVLVYRFRIYDVVSDEFQVSRRWGTSEGIASIRGAEIIAGTEAEIDETEVDSEISGLTRRDFNPHAHRGGFQTAIRS